MSNKISKVSVCVPVYNNPKLVKETIDSILAQTYKDFEIIVIDDGSPDDTTWQAISAYGEPVKAFRQENKGVSATRNACVEKARGEYVAFSDHDDIWAPTKLEKQVALLDQNPGLDFVFSRYKILGSNKIRGVMRHSKDIFTELLTGYFLPPSTMMTRKSSLAGLDLFDVSFKAAEDYEFNLRMAQAKKGICLTEPLVYYRKHDANTSFNASLRTAFYSDGYKQHYPNSYKRICEYWLNSGKLNKLQEKITRKRLARKYYFALARAAREKQNAEKARQALKEAVKLDPFNIKYRIILERLRFLK